MRDPNDVLQLAIQQRGRGDLTGAEETLRSAIAEGVEHKNMYIGLASVLDAQGRPSDAKQILASAYRKFPESAAVLYSYATTLFRDSEYADVIPMFLKVVDLAPDMGPAYENLAISYARIGDWERAKATAEAGLTADTTSVGLLQMLALIHIQLGDFARSLTVYDRMAEVRPMVYGVPQPDMNARLSLEFSRSNPSPRYSELGTQYELMHAETEATNRKTFAGVETFLRVAPHVRNWLGGRNFSRLLDYGGGQGLQYELSTLRDPRGAEYEDMAAYLGVSSVDVFDAGRPATAACLGQRYDAVICTDVLEHCDRQDLPWIVRELFSLADRTVFATIATYPAVKTLPNGKNAHCTLEPAGWWSAVFAQAANDFPNVRYGFLVVNDKSFENVEAFAGGPNH